MTTEAIKPTKQAVNVPANKLPRAIINISLGADNEPRRQFIGANGTDFVVERGKDVEVPISVLGVLDNAVKGVYEPDPNDDTKLVFVERLRFPYTIKQML